MPNKKKKLDWDEHKALEAELHEMRNRLVHLAVELSNTYGVSSKIANRAGKSYQEVVS